MNKFECPVSHDLCPHLMEDGLHCELENPMYDCDDFAYYNCDGEDFEQEGLT